MDQIEIISGFVALSFFYYGMSCLLENRMKAEFYRFGIPQFRRLTGISQLVAASLILLGYLFPILTLIATLALSVQMFLGFILRISIRDSLLQSSPALLFFILNAYLSWKLLEKIF